MAKWQGRSLKKPSSGRIWLSRKKRKYELGRESADTKIGDKKKKEVSVRGNETKSKLLSIDEANITDPETGESIQSEIKNVLENPADPHLARRNIITKGAIIETEACKAKVTSRPGQGGALNAVIMEGSLEEKEEGSEETGDSEDEMKPSESDVEEEKTDAVEE